MTAEPQMPPLDLRPLGIQAAGARYCGQGTAGAAPGAAAGAPWFSSYSRRQAYVMGVNQRVDQLWRDVYQGSVAPEHQAQYETLRSEYQVFVQNWQRFVGGLTIAGMMLPTTEDYAARIDKELVDWSKRFAAMGGKTSHAPYQAPAPSGIGAPPDLGIPWGKILGIVAIIGTVAVIATIAPKLPDLPGPRYA